MSNPKSKNVRSSRIRSIAFCGLSVALIVVSAWISVPIGPVPFTLQTFAVAFVILVLTPKEAMATILIYIALGAVGLPVFSSMRGGIGVLAGPTGGFLWGYILGILAGALILYLFRRIGEKREKKQGVLGASAVDFVAVFTFWVISYVCGWLQFMFVAGVGPVAAFVTALAPFIVVDLVKLVVAVVTAQAVKKALGRR